MDFVVTFLEGVVTFISPCLLPMLPIYVAYFAGGTTAEGMAEGAVGEEVAASSPRTLSSTRTSRTARTAKCALGFIVGFTLVFTVLGAFAGAIGGALVRYQRVLDVVCGVIVVVLGLNYLGVLRIPVLRRTFKPKSDVIPRGFASSVVFGMVFAIGWTPCVGAFLGSALSLAATSGGALTGMALLMCYSLGLGLPFFIAALLIDQLEGAFAKVKAHYRIIDRVCGGLLVVVGLLMASGYLGVWLRLLS